MIRKIEKLGSEFQAGSLRRLKLLEKRKIETVKSRAIDLPTRATQGREIRLPVNCDYRWIRERCRIHPLVDIVFSADGVLPLHKQRHTTHTGGCRNVAGDGKWLAGLKSEDGVYTPSGYDLIDHIITGRKELFPFAEGEIITAAVVKDIADVRVAGAVVDLRTQSRSAVRMAVLLS